MVRDVAAAVRLCHLAEEERELLESAARPIVLSLRRPDADLAGSVAPGQARLGVMLPYTPLHHCLLRDLPGAALVMTSGNRHAEPMAFRDADALQRLGGIADAFILHDRPIHSRCDDSVAIVLGGDRPVRTHVRRSRGFAPLPLRLPFEVATPTLAVGGHMKSTFALAVGRRAFVSHHLGDLDEFLALEAYRAALAHYEELFRVRPQRVVHDAHPDYASTREAFSRADGAVLVAAHHHHAHLASCMADQGLSGSVIGVCFDGSGLGDDGTLWGGEFLVGGYAGVRRAGHLADVGMPGGDRASREGWRMAVAHMRSAGVDPARGAFGARVGQDRIGAIRDLLESDVRCPRTSSIGRLFDAVASITGACDRSTFEGQAAMALEAVASRELGDGTYPYEVRREDGCWVVDPAPLIRQACADVDHALSGVAGRFHETLGQMIADVCARIRDEEHVNDVALTGGVFVNAVLSRSAILHLERAGFRVHRHERVPPNDGGLCLGQLAIAAALDPRGGA
jgi:hydrogenase maturation protein HypF